MGGYNDDLALGHRLRLAFGEGAISEAGPGLFTVSVGLGTRWTARTADAMGYPGGPDGYVGDLRSLADGVEAEEARLLAD